MVDNAIVSFNENSQLEKFYFGTQNANIYIPQDNKEFAIVSSEANGEMPVCFKAIKDGEYTITVSPESVDVSTVEFTVDQMRSIVRNFSGNTEILNQDPSTWIRIISHDGSYSNAIGYVDQMSIGGKTCTGSYFRTNLINYALRSHCFTIKYVKYN